MCVPVCVAPNQSILASNRDEFLARPASPAQWRTVQGPNGRETSVLCGLDSLAGGTWLAVTRNGAFSVLTNVTEEPRPTVDEQGRPLQSRGELVLAWLEAQQSAPSVDEASVLDSLHRMRQRYAGFNLLVGSVHGAEIHLGHVSNRGEATMPLLTGANTGPTGGMSNSTWSTPWPKIEHGQAHLQQVLKETRTTQDALIHRLFDVLRYDEDR
ncbi:hypothetical protein MNAN1_003999 [Malassezia nana]|uniref:NRDE family protein n=1 Tax=Malassezia nana TaxID=180528 RepID=A0AAF0EMS7_9BASI|nr:hypothetical protein MNAN1_003999 [Malassezia nana]